MPKLTGIAVALDVEDALHVVASPSLPAEGPLCKLAERLAGGGRGYLGVDLHGDGDLVAEDLHRRTRVHDRGSQERPAGLAGSVDSDPGRPYLGNAAVEATPGRY